VSNFSGIPWREQVTLWCDDILTSVLYWTNTKTWMFDVLAHWNNSPYIDMSLHLDLLLWLCANQSSFFLMLRA